MVNLLRIADRLPNGTYRLHDRARDWRRVRQTTTQKQFLAKSGLVSVNSSAISAVGVQGNDLVVRFHNGSVYVYDGGAFIFDDIMKSNSKGKFFNKMIKGKFPYAKIQSLQFPNMLQTKETMEYMNVEDTDIFEHIENQTFKDLIKNLIDPVIEINVVEEKGNELLQILINGVAIYYLMDTVLKRANLPRERYFEQLGISL